MEQRIEELAVESADTTDAESRELLEAIEMLPYKWKIVILLHYIEGYSLKEISGILAISENAVKKRMQRAKKALKEKMKQ